MKVLKGTRSLIPQGIPSSNLLVRGFKCGNCTKGILRCQCYLGFNLDDAINNIDPNHNIIQLQYN